MNTTDIETLYLRHAEDFRALLGTAPGTGAVAMVDNRDLEVPAQVGGTWFQRLRGGACRENLHPSIAIAAMTEAWRERVRAKFQCGLWAYDDGRWGAYRLVGGVRKHLLANQGFSVVGRRAQFASRPEAICSIVEALAKEIQERDRLFKQACEETYRQMMSGELKEPIFEKCRVRAEALANEKREAEKPSAAAMRAAKRILEAQAGVNPPAIARIIDEELNREKP